MGDNMVLWLSVNPGRSQGERKLGVAGPALCQLDFRPHQPVRLECRTVHVGYFDGLQWVWDGQYGAPMIFRINSDPVRAPNRPVAEDPKAPLVADSKRRVVQTSAATSESSRSE